MQKNHQEESNVPWKPFIKVTIESILAFYISTFCIAMVFLHRNNYWLIDAIFLGLLYVFVIVVCAKRVLQRLSLPTIMLIVPIAPFIALAIIISLIPVLQLFR